MDAPQLCREREAWLDVSIHWSGIHPAAASKNRKGRMCCVYRWLLIEPSRTRAQQLGSPQDASAEVQKSDGCMMQCLFAARIG